MTTTCLIAAGASHTGCVRQHNEDSFALLPEFGLWVVADGMGGHAAGEVASRIIVEEVASLGIPVSSDDQKARLRERLDRANQRILAHARAHGLGTMGATMAALLIHEGELASVWAGDSRAYLMREGELRALTLDHSEVAALVARGEMTEAEARVSDRRHVITRAIGIAPTCAPDIASGVALPGDRFLICSDGLTEHLADDDLAAALSQRQTPQAVADGLIARTLALGARDNVTVIVIDCEDGDAAVGGGGAGPW